MYSINQETYQYQKEDIIDKVNINSINFNGKHSVISVNLKASSDQARVKVPYKTDTGSDVNIMPLYIYKKIIPYGHKRTTSGKKDENIKLKTCNSTTITNFGRCKVKMENNNRVK